MRPIILAALFIAVGGCASVSGTTRDEGTTGAGGGRNYGIAHRPIQEIQPPPFEADVDTPVLACYSLIDKHEAFGGDAAYAPTSEERRLDDARGGVMRRYAVPEPIAGNCQAPQLLKVVRLDVAIYWSPKTCAHLIRGPLLSVWEQQGANRSELGYPITDELPMAQAVGIHQYFEHGEMAWTPIGGVVVKRFKY